MILSHIQQTEVFVFFFRFVNNFILLDIFVVFYSYIFSFFFCKTVLNGMSLCVALQDTCSTGGILMVGLKNGLQRKK